MGGHRKVASVPSDPNQRRQRLGELLIRRRLDLDPRYRNRQVFADERGVEYRIVSDIERARRSNFHAVTIAEIERAYKLPAGAVARYLDGGSLEPQPLADTGAPRALHAPAARALVDFTEGEKPEVLRPYIEPVLRAAYDALDVLDRLGGDIPDPSEVPGMEQAVAAVPGALLPLTPKETDLWDDRRLMLREKLVIIARSRQLNAQMDEQARRTGLNRACIAAECNFPAVVPVRVAGRAVRASH